MGAWYIASRPEFFDVLERTLEQVRHRRAASPLWVWQSLEAQLEAMRAWTDGGRDPAPEERRRITMGLIAVRELDPQASDDEALLAERLVQLAGYFEKWPRER